MRWIARGIAGWLAAVLPLLGVNLVGSASIFDAETAVIVGASALFGGILLGGLVTGLISGRRGAIHAGSVAAALYTICLIAIVMVATRINAAPAVVVEHPMRITGAIVCLGAILLGLSLLFGMITRMLAGRHASQTAPQEHSSARSSAQRHSMAQPEAPAPPRYEARPSQPARGGYAGAGNRDSAAWDSQRDNENSGRGHSGHGGHGGYGGYGGYDERQPARYPSGPYSREGGRSRNMGRDDEWRENQR